jgi:AbrB family looped-hinge helix DNA binding protein
MPIAKMSAKSWVVIPKDLRKKYGLKPGSRVSLVDVGRGIHLVPIPEDPVGALYGMLAGPGPSMTEQLLEERRLERDREEAKIAYWTHDRASYPHPLPKKRGLFAEAATLKGGPGADWCAVSER